MKNLKLFIVLGLIVLAITACGSSQNSVEIMDLGIQDNGNIVEVSDTSNEAVSAVPAAEISVEYDNDDLAVLDSADAATLIDLADAGINVQGSGVVVDGAAATITSAGTYSISGTLDDGQIIVDTQDEETVVLILNGVNISSSTSAPVYVVNAEKTVISLAAGTQNYVTDGEDYVYPNAEVDEPNAAVFSNDDLTINGEGSLTVTANYNNGIDSNDDLKIASGNITVVAVNDGIKGSDSIAILDGIIKVVAGGDGLQSNNAEDPEKGYISIEGGVFNITAGLDGLQAETMINIVAGDFTIISGGGSSYSTSDDLSMKGIKAGVDLVITGGTFNISAADDALHSNYNLTISDGAFQLASGDDGIHAENSLTINGGDISVIEAFEGFESSVITINAGNVSMVTSDDGLNATNGYGGEQANGSYFYINGGTVLVDASGDGLDSNGSAVITGGIVIVQGPTDQKNGPLDVNGELVVNGGLLISAGSSSMAEVPATSSAQNSIVIALDSTQSAGTIVHIESESGEDILTYESPKAFQLFVFSTAELQTNTTYNVFVGGEATGSITNGLYSDGTYSGGTQLAGVEITSSVTTVGSISESGGKHSRGK